MYALCILIAASDVGISLLQTGEQTSPEAFIFAGGRWLHGHRSAHTAVLVEHDGQRFLFDTGLARDVDAQFAAMPLWARFFFRYERGRSVREQLEADGHSTEEISFVVLSHLHWDHASGLADFATAEVRVPQEAYAFAMSERASPPAFLPSQYRRDGLRWRFIEFVDPAYEGFEQSLDLFKDGSVVLVPLAGHAPGALGMFVRLPSGKRYLFSGDATWAIEGVTRPAEKFVLARLIVDGDRDQTRATLERLHALQKRDPKLHIVPAHDAKTQQHIPHYPAFER